MSETEIEFHVPNTIFKTRVKNEKTDSFEWEDVQSRQLFKNKKSLVICLPGAFTPTCTSKQLPGFEKMYDEFKEHGIDDIYCLSVNDAFVMYNWGKSLDIKKIKMLPDGNGDYTRQMGMLVKKENLGFGMRSWRYVALIDDSVIKTLWIEVGMHDNREDDPYEVTTPENIINWFNTNGGKNGG
tara:strand:+ start:578 stop:1126 length:549 start_codon:yes stop_codon:yes gene_type:complete